MRTGVEGRTLTCTFHLVFTARSLNGRPSVTLCGTRVCGCMIYSLHSLPFPRANAKNIPLAAVNTPGSTSPTHSRNETPQAKVDGRLALKIFFVEILGTR